MSAFDQFVLASALLGGDRDARLILGDLLEEDGRPDLADFSRRAKYSREGDLDLALRLLPAREAVLLGFDYLDHLCSLDGGIYRHEWLLAHVSRLRQLLNRGLQGADLAAGQRKLLYYVGDRDGPILDEAVQALARAVRDVADGADESAPGVAVAAAARYIRESRRNWFRGSRESKRQRQHELEWQVKRAKQVLEEVIAVAGARPPAAEIDYAEEQSATLVAS